MADRRHLEQPLGKWVIDILLNDHIKSEPVEVIITGDEDGYITGVHIKTRNGLKHYGDKVE